MLVEGVLRFGRGVAFAAATAYAAAAEARGTWDARLEALVVDAVVRGPLTRRTPADGRGDDALVSRAAALGLGSRAAGARGRRRGPRPAAAAERLAELRRHGVRTRLAGAGRGAGRRGWSSCQAEAGGDRGPGATTQACSTPSARARSSSDRGPPT